MPTELYPAQHPPGPSRMNFSAEVATWGSRLLDLLLPPTCLGCAGFVDRAQALCGACWGELNFISAPNCAICGLPFPFEADDGALCAACLARRPNYDRAIAATIYDDGSRPLILAFKHGDRTETAELFADWIAAAAGDLIDRADWLIPVPLHRRRLFGRRFNQSALICHALSRRRGIPVDTQSLTRRRATATQGGLNRRQRFQNVRTAFAVPPGRRSELADRRILLIDDVMTTGATVENCARILKRHGARRVDVATVARVVMPRDHTI